jgi:hypothetical protein
MTNFGNLCAITYMNECSADRGATSVIPRSHRVSRAHGRPAVGDGGADDDEEEEEEEEEEEAAGEWIRRPLFTAGSSEGVWNGAYRTVEGIDDVEPSAVTPTVSPVRTFNSFLAIVFVPSLSWRIIILQKVLSSVGGFYGSYT